MGVTNNCARFLFHAKAHHVDFENTLMLGRQQLYTTENELKEVIPAEPHDGMSEILSGTYAEPLFQALGARVVDSLDFSPYEEATVIHDLNVPIPNHLKAKYHVVFDGGTLEHVFNFPAAIKNCMDFLKPGGHFISITPCNNQCGHGFYQFSPELFYSLFTKQHGFAMIFMYLAVELPNGIRDWYEVINPEVAKARVTLLNAYPTYLMILAKKEFDYVHELKVFQSDYSTIWTSHSVANEQLPLGFFVSLYRKLFPKKIRDYIYRLKSGRSDLREIEGLGLANPKYYRKVIKK